MGAAPTSERDTRPPIDTLSGAYGTTQRDRQVHGDTPSEEGAGFPLRGAAGERANTHLVERPGFEPGEREVGMAGLLALGTNHAP